MRTKDYCWLVIVWASGGLLASNIGMGSVVGTAIALVCCVSGLWGASLNFKKKAALLLALSSLVWASPARAELLVSVRHYDTMTLKQAIGSAELRIVSGPLGGPAELGSTFTPDDVGMVINATPMQVAGFQGALSRENASWTSYGVSGHWWSGELWTPRDELFIGVEQFVPQLSDGFIGYTLTDVTMTLDQFEYEPIGGLSSQITTKTQHTVRFYGDVGLAGDYNDDGTVDAADYVVLRDNGNDPVALLTWRTAFGNVTPTSSVLAGPGAVPEPSAMALVLLGCLFHVTGRRCRS